MQYASRLQRSSAGRQQEFHDWGWVFVELTEALYAVNRVLDRQVARAGDDPLPPDDRERVGHMRRHLGMLGVALAEAGAHARGYHDVVSRWGTRTGDEATGIR